MITVNQQSTGFKVGISTLGMALSSHYMSAYADYLNSGGTEYNIYDVALNLPQGKVVYPSHLTSTQYFSRLVDNLTGTYASVASKNAVVTAATDMLTTGMTKGQITKLIVDALVNIPDTDPTWGVASMAFRNKMVIAEYIGLNTALSLTDTELANVIKNITPTTNLSNSNLISTWISTQKTEINPELINLTTGTDPFNGGAGDDTFVSENTSTSTTLNVFDNLNGNGGNDTLKIIDTTNNAFTLSNTIGLSSIETILLQHSANASSSTVTLNVGHLIDLRNIDIQNAGTLSDTSINTSGNVVDIKITNSDDLTINDNGTGDKLTTVKLTNIAGFTTISSNTLTKITTDSTSFNATINTTSQNLTLESTASIALWNITTDTPGALSITTPSGITTTGSINLTDNNLATLKLSGSGSSNLSFTGTKLSSLDASGLSGSLSWTSGALTNTSMVKTAQNGGTYDGSAMTMSSSWTGLGGNDTITVNNNSSNVVHAGHGNNIVTTGSGNDTISVETGNSRITSGAGLDIVTLGIGNHTYISASNANANVYASLTGVNTGDKLDLIGLGATTFFSGKTLLGSNATYTDYLNASTAGAADRVNWFQFGSDTYLVNDNSSGSTFVNGTDQVLKLVGLIDLSGGVIEASSAVLTV